MQQTPVEIRAADSAEKPAATVRVITTPFLLNVTVNCYLLQSEDGFVLIDTGRFSKRGFIERQLLEAGCQPGSLKLIALTHGDFDHCGNAAYLRKKFGGKIALHYDDQGTVQRGDMFWNRQQPNPLVRGLVWLLFRLGQEDRFTPDVSVEEGDNLADYGFDAQVIALPGHSKGSVGFLTAGGDLFCGDLLANTAQPDVWTVVDNPTAMQASVDKLKHYAIQMIYPGHGKPFSMAEFRAHHSS